MEVVGRWGVESYLQVELVAVAAGQTGFALRSVKSGKGGRAARS